MERNIYKIGKELFITSDEEIKEGDWILDLEDLTIGKVKDAKDKHNIEIVYNNQGVGLSCNVKDCSEAIKYPIIKIILTTDQDLIKDGVQAIDDEFLEWFVQNPSCEEVKLMNVYGYAEIIIPKKEPKQHIELINENIEKLDEGIKSFKHKCEVLSKEYIMENRSNAYEFIDFDKQETLEEACERIGGDLDYREFDNTSFKLGAKWQQDKKLYSEEDLDAFRKFMIQEQNFSKSCLDVFIEQFKKK